MLACGAVHKGAVDGAGEASAPRRVQIETNLGVPKHCDINMVAAGGGRRRIGGSLLPSLSSWRFRAVTTIVLVGFAIGQPAAAFELFGIKFFERKNAEDTDDVIGEPQNYTVDFQIPGADSDTVDALQGASTLWQDREKPASGAAGLIAKARGDYRRLLATLYSQARYGGTISILIDGREAADLAPDAQLADPASVRVTVDPGPLFHFGQAEIVNQAPPPADSDDEVDLPAKKGFVTGGLARSGVVLRGRTPFGRGVAAAGPCQG